MTRLADKHTEADVLAQLLAAADAARQHRERRLHRLDEGGIGQALGDVVAVAGVEFGEAVGGFELRGFGAFSTSTRHMRQFAAIDNFL